MIYAIREGKAKALKVEKKTLQVFVGSSMETGHEKWILSMALVGKSKELKKNKVRIESSIYQITGYIQWSRREETGSLYCGRPQMLRRYI